MAEQATQTPAPSSRDGIERWWDPLIAFFGGNLAGGLLGAIAAVVLLVIAIRAGFDPTEKNLTTLIKTDFPLNMLLLVISDAGWLAATWLVARRRFARPIAHYFAPASGVTVLLAGLSGVALSVLINGGNQLLARAMPGVFQDTDFDRLLVPHGAGQIAAAIAVIGLFVPFVEEFFFRGMLFAWMRRAWGAWAGVVVTGVLFGAVHGHVFLHPGLQGLIYTGELTVAGIALTLWVARTGSLRTSFAMHIGHNVAAILFSVLLP